MSHRSRLIVAAAMGLLAMLASDAYLRGRENELVGATAPAGVCVAAKDILGNAVVDETLVKRTEVPSRYLQPLSVGDCGEAVGRVTAIPVPAGAQLLSTALLDRHDSGLAPLVARSQRAVTIAVDAVTGVAGLVRPGNLVDIFATVVFAQAPNRDDGRVTSPDERTEVRLLMERIPVVAVGQELITTRPETMGEGQPRTLADRDAGAAAALSPTRDIRTVTLSVTPRQAQEIVLAQHVGRLTLMLRTNLDSGNANLGTLDPVSLFNVPLPIKSPGQNFTEFHGPTF